MISYRALAMRVLGKPLPVQTHAARPAAHRVTALALTAAMAAALAAPAFADTYYLGNGDITVTQNEDGKIYVRQGDGDEVEDSDGNVVIKGSEEVAVNASNEMAYTDNTVDFGTQESKESEGPVVETPAPADEETTEETSTAEDEKTPEEEGTTEDEETVEETPAPADEETVEETPAPEGEETVEETPAAEDEGVVEETPAADTLEAAAPIPVAEDKTPAEDEDKAEPEENKSALEKAADNFVKAANNTINNIIRIINNAKDKELNVTLDNVKADAAGKDEDALGIHGYGDVKLNLKGQNEFTGDSVRTDFTDGTSGTYGTSGIKSYDAGHLTITGEKDASLTATGGDGDYSGDGIFAQGGLTINGTTVTANGGNGGNGSGISSGSDTTILDSTVEATGGDGSTGNGNTSGGDGIHVLGELNIGSSDVTGKGGKGNSEKDALGAGGYGIRNIGGNMTITGSKVEATGGDGFMGGDGLRSRSVTIPNNNKEKIGGNLTITDSEVTGKGGNGVGGPYTDTWIDEDDGKTYTSVDTSNGGDGIVGSEDVTITGDSSNVAAEGGSGYYAGTALDGGNMTISGGTVSAKGGEGIGESFSYEYYDDEKDTYETVTETTSGGDGIDVWGNLLITGGNITSTIGGSGGHGGSGIYAETATITSTAHIGTAQGGNSNEGYDFGGAGIDGYGDLTIDGNATIDTVKGGNGFVGGTGLVGGSVTIKDNAKIGSVTGGNGSAPASMLPMSGGFGIAADGGDVTIQGNADLGTVKGGSSSAGVGGYGIAASSGITTDEDGNVIDVTGGNITLEGNVKADISAGSGTSDGSALATVVMNRDNDKLTYTITEKKLSDLDLTELGEEADVTLRDANGTVLESTKKDTPENPDPDQPDPDKPNPDQPEPTPDPEPTPTPGGSDSGDSGDSGSSDSDTPATPAPAPIETPVEVPAETPVETPAPVETPVETPAEAPAPVVEPIVITPDGVVGIDVSTVTGKNVSVDAAVKDDTLSLSTSTLAVTVTTTSTELRNLKANGVEYITLNTATGPVTFSVDELLALCGTDNIEVLLTLTHMGFFTHVSAGSVSTTYLFK